MSPAIGNSSDWTYTMCERGGKYIWNQSLADISTAVALGGKCGVITP